MHWTVCFQVLIRHFRQKPNCFLRKINFQLFMLSQDFTCYVHLLHLNEISPVSGTPWNLLGSLLNVNRNPKTTLFVIFSLRITLQQNVKHKTLERWVTCTCQCFCFWWHTTTIKSLIKKSVHVAAANKIILHKVEAVAQRCSVEKVFLEISQSLQENTFARGL